MIREDKFLISHAPYAVKLDSLRTRSVGNHPWWNCSVTAAWFRRKEGINYACLGEIPGSIEHEPVDAADFLTSYTDGRWGGGPKARWDGSNLWAPESTWDQMKEYEEFLRPMLENFPEVPPSFDGWWTFKGAK